YPTATSCAPRRATAVNVRFVPALREVQVTPSGEVRIVAGDVPSCGLRPTATNWAPCQTTPRSTLGVPEVWFVQTDWEKAAVRKPDKRPIEESDLNMPDSWRLRGT